MIHGVLGREVDYGRGKSDENRCQFFLNSVLPRWRRSRKRTDTDSKDRRVALVACPPVFRGLCPLVGKPPVPPHSVRKAGVSSVPILSRCNMAFPARGAS